MARLTLSARTEMRATPALLSLARLLALPSMSLHQVVREELAANPALEEVEADRLCPACGGPMIAGLCPRCAADGDDVREPLSGDEWWPIVASPVTPVDALLADLRASLPGADHAIAQAIVGNLDERRFLGEPPAAIARALGVDRARVDAVLALLKRLGPPGIAETEARLSLLAQLDALAASGVTCPFARDIVASHLDDLALHRRHLIARRLGITVADVEQVGDFLRQRLRPYPLEDAAEPATAPDARHYWLADLAIFWDGDEPRVELLASATHLLRLNPLYAELAQQPGSLDAEERAHVVSHVNRARLFLRSLRQRQQTLQRVGEQVALRQEAFLRHGVQHLAPLTRIEVAADLGLHHATVGRAVQDKVAQLPNRALWPMEGFFDGSRAAMETLRDLIAERGHELTDQELADALAARGLPVARRTVTKYRQRLGIARSRDRDQP